MISPRGARRRGTAVPVTLISSGLVRKVSLPTRTSIAGMDAGPSFSGSNCQEKVRLAEVFPLIHWNEEDRKGPAAARRLTIGGRLGGSMLRGSESPEIRTVSVTESSPEISSALTSALTSVAAEAGG